jgi:hypothetical protein
MNLNGSVFWCFSISLRYTSQLGFGCFPLMEEARKLGVDDARDPVQRKFSLWKAAWLVPM